MSEGGWFDQEAIDAERFDADIEMAEFEAVARRHARRGVKMRTLRAAGKFAEAAAVCPHGGGYPLDSPAATNAKDPHAGEKGWRCSDCGSRLEKDPWEGGRVTVPCEVKS